MNTRRSGIHDASGTGWRRALLLFAVVGSLAQAADAPELYLSLQGVADGTIEQGEPLRVSVRIEAPDGAGPWLIAPGSGTWVDAVAVEILVEGRSEAMARGLVVGQAEQPTATIDDEHIAGGLWRFPGYLMQRLAPGSYRLRATLAVADGAGWRGSARSDEVPLTVIPPSDDPGRAGLKALGLARDALLEGEAEAAASLLDAELARDPLQFRVLVLRATVAEEAGNLLSAQMLLNLARLSADETPGGYPNLDFEETRARVWAGLLSETTNRPSSEPPAWSWPPTSVLRVLAERVKAELPGEVGAVVQAEADSPPEGAPLPAAEPAAAAVTEPEPEPAPPAPTVITQPAGDAATGPRHWVGDQAVPAHTNGQWAGAARAGSQYGDIERAAARATGAPDVPGADDHPNAWCPAVRDRGSDWLELTFARAAPATEVRVRQSFGPGAIVKVEAIEPGGQAHVWWEGVDLFGQDGFADDAVWFGLRVPLTNYDVEKIRLTLNLGAHGRWKQIDAVLLIGATPH